MTDLLSWGLPIILSAFLLWERSNSVSYSNPKLPRLIGSAVLCAVLCFVPGEEKCHSTDWVGSQRYFLSISGVSHPRRCSVAVGSRCFRATFFLYKNRSIMKGFCSVSLGRAGAEGQGNSLAARWIHPSALSYMGTLCPSVIPYASWWFPQEELHNCFLFLNNSCFLVEMGWNRTESCIRAEGKAILSF